MQRSILSLIYGLSCGVLLTSLLSVYVFHDLDQGQIGHLNAAFSGLLNEGLWFVLIIANATALLLRLAKRVFPARPVPSGKLCYLLGAGIATLQYPCDLLTRKVWPNASGTYLVVYMIFAVLLSTIILAGWQPGAGGRRET